MISTGKFPTSFQEFIYIRTYSRWVEEISRRETWPETVQRYTNFIQKNLGDKLTLKEINDINKAILNFEVMPSMRALWAAGGAAEADNLALYNCSFIAIEELKNFAEILYILMNGTGAGFTVEKEFINKLPVISEETKAGKPDVIVFEDSKIGWAQGFEEVLNCLWKGIPFECDYSKVRPRGARLKTMGGRASGPEPLKDLVRFVTNIAEANRGHQIQSIDAHDICCKIADIVVVGGVRRSACISLSDLDDRTMAGAKKGEFWNSNPQRMLANNSATYLRKPSVGMFLEEWKHLYQSNSGERGIFNRMAAKKKAAENHRRDASKVQGTNPCGEILLRSAELCNLSEVVVRPEDTFDTLKQKVKIAALIGTCQACFTKFNFIDNKWIENCEDERLLGVSLTGLRDHPILGNVNDEAKKWLADLKHIAIQTNKKAATKLGINRATAITCVKPSGCQKKETMLITNNGILTFEEIGDIYGEQWQKHEVIVANKNNNKMSTKFYINGEAKTLKIKMQSGLELEATENHQYQKFSVDNNNLMWVQSNCLKVGDMLPYKVGGYLKEENIELIQITKPYCNVKEIIQPLKMTEKLAYLLGLYYGDGSNHTRGIRIAGNYDDINILEKAKDIVEEVFGITGKIYIRTKGNNADLFFNSTFLLAWLGANGLLKQKTANVEIPLAIRQCSNKIIEQFFNGYFDADGCMDKNGLRTFVTISKKMAEQTVICLRAIGIDAGYREMPPTEKSWGTNMRYWIQEKKGRNGNYAKSVYREGFQQLDEADLGYLTPDYIVSIEESINDTFDIEVPDGNEYLANSYISHNTVSLLVDSAPGAHVRQTKTGYYIRRVRISATDPLFRLLAEQGAPFQCEVGQSPENCSSYVLEFPCKAPLLNQTRNNESAIEQLEYWKMLRTFWCEHNPSITVSVKEEEWLDTAAWVYRNFDDICGVSFLPSSDHVYQLAPYEDITKEQYEKLIKEMPKINFDKLNEYELEDGTLGSKEYACTGGSCELV